MNVTTVAVLAAAALVALPSAVQAQTSAHAMVVAGRAGHVGGGPFDCATSGPQARELSFFNTGVGLPTEGYSYCGLAGGIQNLSGATSTGLARQDVTTSFNMGTATVSADASASIATLHVKASGSNTATSYDGFNYAGAEGAAYSSDAVTFMGTGSQLMRFQFSIDGSALTTGNSQALTLFDYQFGSDPNYGAGVSNVRGSDTGTFTNPTGPSGTVPGFTVGPGSFSGAGDLFTFNTLVALGTPLQMNIGLYAAAYPSPFGGTATNDFYATLRLSGIAFVDGSGNVLDLPVSGIGSSGYLYDGAVAGVPEPRSWATMLLGLSAIGGLLRRRKLTEDARGRLRADPEPATQCL